MAGRASRPSAGSWAPPWGGVSFHALSSLFKPGGAATPRGRSDGRSNWRLWALLVAGLIVLLQLQGIFASGPWDPWETHYGEVARSILSRDDPMDLWWRPGFGPDGKKEQSFASKHAMPFWCMAVSLRLFGLGTGPDPGEMVQPYLPELALRLPGLLASWAMIAFWAYVVWRLVSPRAALLVALVMATTPQLAIVGRQAITDIYFVGPVALAMGAWILAHEGPDRRITRRRLGPLSIPSDRVWWVFVAAFVLFAMVPVVVLQAHVWDAHTIARVGTWSKRPTIPGVDDLAQVGRHLMIYWATSLVVLVAAWRWRTRAQIWMGVVYLAAGLALMGKGLLGPGIIGALIATHLLVTGRWDRLLRSQLPLGVVIFVTACFPWHHAMALFREDVWVQELLIDNNLTRFVSGEQDQAVGGFVYYLRTLGLAALPWSCVLPVVVWVALQRFRRGATTLPSTATRLWRFVFLWFAVTFGVISYSVTKYYHYLAPVLPPLAIATGLWLDRVLGESPQSPDESAGPSRTGRLLAWGLAVAAGVLVLQVWVLEPAWLAHLTTYLYTAMWTDGAPRTNITVWLCLPFALGLLAWVFRRGRAAVAGMLLSSVLLTGWIFARYIPEASEHWSQRNLFRVLYDNRGPEDPVMSWWFYYRGETFFSKRHIWVLTEPKREQTAKFVDEHRGQGRTLWIVTTAAHAKRAENYFPPDLHGKFELHYENAHYALLSVPVP